MKARKETQAGNTDFSERTPLWHLAGMQSFNWLLATILPPHWLSWQAVRWGAVTLKTDSYRLFQSGHIRTGLAWRILCNWFPMIYLICLSTISRKKKKNMWLHIVTESTQVSVFRLRSLVQCHFNHRKSYCKREPSMVISSRRIWYVKPSIEDTNELAWILATPAGVSRILNHLLL